MVINVIQIHTVYRSSVSRCNHTAILCSYFLPCRVHFMSAFFCILWVLPFCLTSHFLSLTLTLQPLHVTCRLNFPFSHTGCGGRNNVRMSIIPCIENANKIKTNIKTLFLFIQAHSFKFIGVLYFRN